MATLSTRKFLGVLVALACWCACAVEQGSPGVRVEKDIAYITDGDAAQKLDLYLPEKPSEKPLPLIVWVHGGAWRAGSKAGGPAVGMVARGYAVASVEYRFVPKALFPAQIQDCQAAIRWLRANRAKYNFDPDHIGAWGSSAGGHLVALLGTAGGKKAYPAIGGNEDQSDRVQAVCDLYGPADFSTVAQQAEEDKGVKNIWKFNTPGDPYSDLVGVKLDADKAKVDAVSPVHFVSQDNPPFLIVHGTKDALVPLAQSVELETSLKKAGVSVLLQRLPNSGHGGPMFSKPAINKLIQTFFDKHLKGMDVPIELVPETDVTAPDEPVKTK